MKFKMDKICPETDRREGGSIYRAEVRSEDDGVVTALRRGRAAQPQAEKLTALSTSGFGTGFILFIVYCLLFTVIGCDAFVRKFTRKPKKDKEQKEELVLVPVEYETEKISKHDLYQQYFLFWIGWQEQLIDSLTSDTNRKRSIGCAAEALNSLEQMQKLLKNEKQQELSLYIEQSRQLVKTMEDDPYRSKVNFYLASASRLKAQIRKKFSFNKIKDYLQ